MSEEDTSEEMQKIFSRYEGEKARIYLYGGRTLYGKLHFGGGWVEITLQTNDALKRALCNLQYVVSIAPE